MAYWTLLGCGALGGVLAGMLDRTGHQVSLISTQFSDGDHHAVTLPLDLSWTDLHGHRHHFTPDFLHTKDAPNVVQLMVCTKAYQVETALEPLIGQLSEATPILLMHNGMGTLSWLRRTFPNNPLLIGITSNGALRRDDTHFQHTGAGDTWIGPANQQASTWSCLADQLASALPHVAWTDQILLRQLEKLVINAVINPLTALSGDTNGSLLSRQDEVDTLCHELHPLLLREGLTYSVEDWVGKVLDVAQKTAGNYSSMQQDLAAGRHTEIDYITGYLLREAQPYGIAMPTHQALYDAIKAREPQPD